MMTRAVAAALCLAALTACDQDASSPKPDADGGPAKAESSSAVPQPTVPDLPASYRFEVATVCDSPGYGVYEVAVQDGRVVDSQRKPGTPVRIPPLEDFPTLTELAVLARDTDVPGERVEYRVDAAGIPKALTLDPILNAQDDERCWFVSNYEPTTR